MEALRRDFDPERVGLTRDQADCARVIAELTALNGGASPSYREIMEEMGINSKSRISELVGDLEHRGWLVRNRSESRSLRMLAVPAPAAEYAYDVTAAGRAALSQGV
jgi:SOS-response transcriptional repressor LexA